MGIVQKESISNINKQYSFQSTNISNINNSYSFQTKMHYKENINYYNNGIKFHPSLYHPNIISNFLAKINIKSVDEPRLDFHYMDLSYSM